MLQRGVGLAVALVMLSGFAAAQENATLVLRSGQPISGRLVELSGLDFVVDVGGTERTVAARDVAVIEFPGSEVDEIDWASMPANQQALCLRSGAIITGQLYDISGSSPLKITFQTPSGTREFSSREIGRIVLARPLHAAPSDGRRD